METNQTTQNPHAERPKVILTGASGYIGHNLMQKLKEDYDVIALSRHGSSHEDEEHVEWRSCDFYSMDDAVEALQGADYAFYLIHSMMPTAKLTQGDFEDMDAILADNFARAAKKNGIGHIVYLSGIVPDNMEEKDLSRHLRSRLEVQRILESSGVPVTTIRAGLIVGPQGSSFPILYKLVDRLPLMTLPKWTRTETHAIALDDVLNSLKNSVGNEEVQGRVVDVGGPDVMSYKEMMRQMAEVLGVKRHFIDVPFLTVNLSRLWVTLVTQAPREMAYPLIESLIHPMVADPDKMVEGISYGTKSFKEAAKESLEEEKRKQEDAERKQRESSRNEESKPTESSAKKADVRSVQRVTLPEGKDAHWAGEYYMDWLGRVMTPLIRTERDENGVGRVYIRFFSRPILELTYDAAKSGPDRAVYRITGGMFARAEEGHTGRLEFLQIPGSSDCVIAIHDYMPAIPWFLYKYTQAKLHLIVMYVFRKHLERLGNLGPSATSKHAEESPRTEDSASGIVPAGAES
ncbi:NAD(P)H-binding protein [Saccharibacillus sp. CPCC 101409]|uniref:NAD(P)H-binding protein n=1 Tax=Saccharibacillus sp. CPCC 101409 TaxID=3058041 RepID=UPI002670E78D|nr:NAD(P)H-binding protein [Saccharibacillus sp. CPCC 101409]MDO3410829.1 NAD(P)H-binding protein [Saccharibacillus sp. CPCC 101409]